MAGRVVRTYDPRAVRKVSERAKKMMNTYMPKLGYQYTGLEPQTKSYPERHGVQVTEHALEMIKDMPRVALSNIKELPTKPKKNQRGRQSGWKMKGRGLKGQGQRGTWDPLGYEGGQQPLMQTSPSEKYYGKYALRRQYPPISLLEVQRLIDLGRVDISRPLDLTTFCNTRLFRIDLASQHYGFNLTEEGCDIFSAPVNLEVQWTSEVVIAAVERAGGTVTTRYFDPVSVAAMADPQAFFMKGLAIPRCKLPPQDCLEFYSNPENRGYLADPAEIASARESLAQKYGYTLPKPKDDAHKKLLLMRKDPLQIFHGLQPGWLVSLRDKLVLKPHDKDHDRYFNTGYQ